MIRMVMFPNFFHIFIFFPLQARARYYCRDPKQKGKNINHKQKRHLGEMAKVKKSPTCLGMEEIVA